MTDTPIVPPSTKGERLKAAIGDLARPFAIYSTASATAYAICTKDAGVITAAGLILAALYAGKVIESATQSVQTAKVEQAKATAAPALATANATPAPVTAPPEAPMPAGPLPPWERPS